MNTITITSGTLKGAYSLDYSYVQKTDVGENNVKMSCNAPIHEDLKTAFENLIPHLAMICEEVTKKEVKNVIDNGFPEIEEGDSEHPIKEKFNVHAFKITGNGDSEGVAISGTKLLKIGKAVNITTPKLRWDEDYAFIDELSEAIEQCKIEVNEYLNGKHAPDNQVDMFEGYEVEAEVITSKSA
ncbi:hypothetical protein FORMB_17160 [Formosa sp. Hel1_33_131]|uniref:hypothetical protein n=1 Tax=Formosa sp. Hel1_33_131 TaxID=1336794 RepID=UPI00084E29BC|nr:hypothetical protein [Formosa sp. Hel1_33_131]AOR28755.1 hypothetical protein FORMB_17160 [Formosa sp. Hel1_33_131]